MPREGVIIFRDPVGRLDVLNVECDKWDCPRKQATNLNDECGTQSVEVV
jgi:hypothetical protein